MPNPTEISVRHTGDMTRARKRALKRFLIRWELHIYGATATLYVVALGLTWWLFPDVSNLTLQLTLLFVGFTGTMAAMASAIKSSDTDE